MAYLFLATEKVNSHDLLNYSLFRKSQFYATFLEYFDSSQQIAEHILVLVAILKLNSTYLKNTNNLRKSVDFIR